MGGALNNDLALFRIANTPPMQHNGISRVNYLGAVPPCVQSYTYLTYRYRTDNSPQTVGTGLRHRDK